MTAGDAGGVRAIEPFGAPEKIFTTVLMLAGVGTALYTLGVLLETLVEGQLMAFIGRRRMDRDIRGLSGHTIIAGWGRVGRTIARELPACGEPALDHGLSLARVVEVFLA